MYVLIAPHAAEEPDDPGGRYLRIVEEMRSLGPPVLDAVQIDDFVYVLVEGSNRIRAAYELKLSPCLRVLSDHPKVETIVGEFEDADTAEQDAMSYEFDCVTLT